MKITLSHRQAKAADRVGGVELMVPWPASLGPEPEVSLDHEREATTAEKTAAEALVRANCAARDLVPVHIRVTRVMRPSHPELIAAGEERVHLAITIIGRRWVHASTHSRGIIAWHNGETA